MSELYHFVFGKKSNQDHKYVAKVQEGKRTRYFYSDAEYRAYKSGNKPNLIDQAKNKLQNTANNIKQTVNDKKTEVKKAFSSENMYNSNKWNYENQKQRVTDTKEWKDIVRNKDPEYTYRDSEGKTKYNYDQYLLNKKHPILDVAQDWMMGRKASINKVTPQSLAAGLKDYHTMAVNTVNNILTVGGGITIAMLMNNQGSFEEKKQEVRKSVKETGEAAEAAVELITTYNEANNTIDTLNKARDSLSKQATSWEENGKLDTKELPKSVQSINNVTNEAIKSYAKANGISEEEARRQLVKRAKDAAKSVR